MPAHIIRHFRQMRDIVDKEREIGRLRHGARVVGARSLSYRAGDAISAIAIACRLASSAAFERCHRPSSAASRLTRLLA